MFAHARKDRTGARRGVILVVILGMLGLLALIGVTFASFSGQSRISAVNFSLAQKFPDSSELMDYALSQLIMDTSNPQSVIRGHSLLRDMYGNDALHAGAMFNGLSDGTALQVTSASLETSGTYAGLIKLTTNIPTNSYDSYLMPNCTRWIMRFPAGYDGTASYHPAQTAEIITDDLADATNYRLFYVANDTSPDTSITGFQSPEDSNVTKGFLYTLSADYFNTYKPNFQLDGRFLRAFNGGGMASVGVDNAGFPLSEYANFRYNGNVINSVVNSNGSQDYTPGISSNFHDPNAVVGMDEDYDAPDLENWFLAIQSADGKVGKVVIPSFHRPGIVSAVDWSNVYNSSMSSTDNSTLAVTRSMSRILRPRHIDGHSAVSFPDLIPVNKAITYDVDNDGDTVSDAVWLDLGYPPQSNNEGQVFKPMFAFTVIGLNGKLPLNTAGNLQSINTATGSPTFGHASHLGYSPSEIDLTYGLQNGYVYDASGTTNPFDISTAPTYSQVDDANLDRSTGVYGDKGLSANVSTVQLRNILAGTRQPDPSYDPSNPTGTAPTSNYDINSVMVNGLPTLFPNGVVDGADITTTVGSNYQVLVGTPPVAGRWGEETGIPQILTRATSVMDAPINHYSNMIRAGLSFINYNTVDARDDNYDTFDIYPAFGTSSHPENADYYDLTGSLVLPVERLRRFVTPVDISGNGRVRTYGTESATTTGADKFGRISFFGYFRPPGLLIDTTTSGTANYNELATWDDTANPAGPRGVYHAFNGKDADQNKAAFPSNNRLHGYEGFRDPFVVSALGNSNTPAGAFVGGMIGDTSGNGLSVGSITTPSFDSNVNSNGNFPSLGMNLADELKLYGPSQYDLPFGPPDLEWLYRFQDVDGQSLYSRLATLAPISFTNPEDGDRRRRLFALDSFDTTNFVWSGHSLANNGYGQNGQTPSIAHRDRKINLNFPLPVSNSPIEPVRLKWIRETYQLMKTVLPKTATDTPEELAQLSQYLINVIDFRDPDCTSTQFTNPDVTTKTGTTTTAPSISLSVGAGTLVQHGMEYSPIAINEVLAYRFHTKTQNQKPSTAVSRMFFEIVNLLSQDNTTGLADGDHITNDLDLTGWSAVVLPDDGLGRPDPVTGQIPDQGSGGHTVNYRPLAGGTTVSPTPFSRAQMIPALPTAATSVMDTTKPAPRGTDNKNYYFVFGNNFSSGNQLTATNNIVTQVAPPAQPGDSTKPIEIGWPAGLYGSASGTANIVPNVIGLDLTVDLPNENQYYWLYLVRPANPFDPNNSDPASKVVVDSFRFMYTTSQGRADYNQQTQKDYLTVAPSPDYIYSLQRMQPLRGGHAIPPLTADVSNAPSNYVVTSYGYSEQTFPANTVGTKAVVYGQYGDGVANNTKTTGQICNTLGYPNTSTNTASPAVTITNDDNWEYVPFNDRDFANVMELTLVPAVPPGLFTKRFIESAPPISFTNTPMYPTLTGTNKLSTTTPIPSNNPTQYTASSAPRTFPYLSDKFFYSGEHEPTGGYPAPSTGPAPKSATSPNNYIDGPSGAGWHAMFDFFDVPSPMFGSIGTVEQGLNYDWARKDLKPGLLNLNLIIDEEVFLGLMGSRYVNVMDMNPPSKMPTVALQGDGSGGVVTASSSTIGTHGYIRAGGTGALDQLKAAFTDFLILRHGGSGTLYGYGHGLTGSTSPLAAERPFRSYSYQDSNKNYDINMTLMRPAVLPPSSATNPAASPDVTSGSSTQPSPYYADPGVKNAYLFINNSPVQPPPIPTRRLFQVPDGYAPSMGIASNASPLGDTNINTFIKNTNLTNQDNDLVGESAGSANYLGNADNRDHPFFRGEWMQRISALTTVRTHQFAVWITVGFFEVLQQGDPNLAPFSPFGAYDIIGLELGLIDGTNTRYRSFFLVDRTRAFGFNPHHPGDFRDMVVYRQTIED